MLVQDVNMEISKFHFYDTHGNTEAHRIKMNQRNYAASYCPN